MTNEPRREFIQVGEGEIHALIAGEGPPLLLLHGFPQTHVMWFPILPALADHFTVVAADLRGYGDSFKPAAEGETHAAMSKRAMAEDMVTVMETLGFERFSVVGHDRGARVARRLALDHGAAVDRLALLDIVPTRTVFETVNQRVATAYYHWFFLIQPDRLPERLIAGDPDAFLDFCLARMGQGMDGFDERAVAEYRRQIHDPAAVHAMCEDYRAGATIDLEHDRADADARHDGPTLILWGENGLVGQAYDPLAIWREQFPQADGRSIPAGHFLVEEAPDDTYRALTGFLADA